MVFSGIYSGKDQENLVHFFSFKPPQQVIWHVTVNNFYIILQTKDGWLIYLFVIYPIIPYYISNRPGVAGAVLQSPLVTSLIIHWLKWVSQNIFQIHSIPHYVSGVRYHLSGVTCHVSPVTYHMSPVTCQTFSSYPFFFIKN